MENRKVDFELAMKHFLDLAWWCMLWRFLLHSESGVITTRGRSDHLGETHFAILDRHRRSGVVGVGGHLHFLPHGDCQVAEQVASR